MTIRIGIWLLAAVLWLPACSKRPSASSGATGGSTTGDTVSRVGGGTGDGIVFEGGDPFLAYSDAALDHAATTFEAIVRGETSQLCQSPGVDYAHPAIHAELSGLTAVQLGECRRAVVALAPLFLSAIRTHRPTVELRIGPLTVGDREVVAKTVASLGEKILVDVAKIALLPLPLVAALVLHELGHQITRRGDTDEQAGFRDVRHWLDVIAMAVASLMYRDLAPSRSIQLMALSDGRYVVLGLSDDGVLRFRVLGADLAPVAPWQVASPTDKFQQIVVAGQVLFGLDFDAKARWVRFRPDEAITTDSWSYVTDAPGLLQIDVNKLPDGRLVVGGLVGDAHVIKLLPENTLGSMTFGAWITTSLSGANHFSIGMANEGGTKRSYIFGNTNSDSQNDFYYARYTAITQVGSLAWTGNYRPLVPTGGGVWDPGAPPLHQLVVQGTRPFFLQNSNMPMFWTNDTSAVLNPLPAFPTLPAIRALLSGRTTFLAAAYAPADDRLVYVILDHTGALSIQRALDDKLNFGEVWHTIGFNLSVANRFQPFLSGYVKTVQCPHNPRMVGTRLEYGSREQLMADISYANDTCLNAPEIPFYWAYRLQDGLNATGNFMPLPNAAPGTQSCKVRVPNNCPRFPEWSTERPILPTPTAKHLCLGMAENYARACGLDNKPTVYILFQEVSGQRGRLQLHLSTSPLLGD